MQTFNKLFQILNVKQKTNFLIQFVLMIFGTGLEMLGIGILLPIIAIMSQGASAFKSNFVVSIANKLGIHSNQSLLMGVLILLIIINLIKMLFLGFISWKQNSFIYGLQAYFSQKLYFGYLHKNYVFHTQRNSSELINNCTMVISQFSGSLMSILNVITEIFNLAGILVLLLIIEPLGSVMVFSILGIAAWIFYGFAKKKLYRWGNELTVHESMRIKHLQQGFGGLKEIKIFGKEKEFAEKYKWHSDITARINRNFQTIQALPRLWLEFLSIVGIFILINFMLLHGDSVLLVLPKLGIFTAAAFRLIPSMNKIISSMQNVRYAKQPLEVLCRELSIINQKAENSSIQIKSFQNSLKLNNISFRYPNAEKDSIKNLSLEIQKGETIGFIGTTGAGKSTLVDIVLGLLDPSNGVVFVDNVDIHSDIRGWQNQIGYVPQFIFLIDDTLRNNIAFGVPEANISEEAIERAVKLAQLDIMVNELPEGLDTNVGERGVRLSGGQRQRVGIARALYRNPSIIVLDEATSSLDVETESNVMDSIRSLHGTKTILIIAHRYSTIEHCDTIYKLQNGEIIQKGKPIELLN